MLSSFKRKQQYHFSFPCIQSSTHQALNVFQQWLDVLILFMPWGIVHITAFAFELMRHECFHACLPPLLLQQLHVVTQMYIPAMMRMDAHTLTTNSTASTILRISPQTRGCRVINLCSQFLSMLSSYFSNSFK